MRMLGHGFEHFERDAVAGGFARGEEAELFEHELGHAVDLVARATGDVRGEEDVGEGVEGGVFDGGLGEGDVEDGGALGLFLEGADEVGLDDLGAASGIDERGIGLHARELLIGEHADGGGEVGDVVGDGLAGGEDFVERGLADSIGGGLLIGVEGVVDEDVDVVIALEALDDGAADHAGAEDADGDVVVARERGKVAVGIGASGEGLGAVAGLEEALVGQDDLGDGVLDDGDGIGAPSAKDLDAALEEFVGEALDGTGGIEDGLEGGEVGADFVGGEVGHAPSGEEVGGIEGTIGEDVVAREEGVGDEACLLLEGGEGAGGIDAGEAVPIAKEKAFHRG